MNRYPTELPFESTITDSPSRVLIRSDQSRSQDVGICTFSYSTGLKVMLASPLDKRCPQ